MSLARSCPSTLCGLLALAGAGCASHATDAPAPAEAIEQARREERQKVLQQYWQDRTASLSGPPPVSPGSSPDLSYPAGIYGGLRFAPRQARDASLAEPAR